MAGVVKNMMVRVGADLSGLIGGFKKAGGATSSFAKQASDALRGTTLSHVNLTKAMAQGDKNTYIVSLTDQIRELEQEQKALKAAGFSWGYEGFEKNEALLRSLKNELNDYIKSVQMADGEAEKFEASTKDAFSSVKTKAGGATNGVEGLLKSIKRLGVVSLSLRFVRSIFGELGSIVRQYISENEALQAQVNALKSSFGQALAPAINVVTNALAKMMPYIQAVSNAISSLITNLFGSGWTTVAANATAATKAIGGTGGAADKLKRSLQGFDEITKLNDSSSGGGGSSASSAAASIEGALPTWIANLTEQVKQSIETGDWSTVGKTLAEKLSEVIADLDLTVLMKNLPSLQKSLTTFFEGWFSGLSWDSIGEFLKTNIEGFFKNFDFGNLMGNVFSSVAIDPISKSALKALGKNSSSYFKPFIEALEGEYDTVAEQIVVGVLMGIGDALLNAGTWLKTYVLEPLSKGLQNLFDNTEVGKFKVGVKNENSKWWSNVKSWWAQKITQPVKSFTTGVKNEASDWWQSVKDWWAQKVGQVQTFKTSVKNDASAWWQSVKNWWSEVVGTLLMDAFVRDESSTWWENVKTWWSKAVGTLLMNAFVRDESKTWWQNVKDWWKETVGYGALSVGVSIKNEASKWWESVKTWWNGIVTELTVSLGFDGGTTSGKSKTLNSNMYNSEATLPLGNKSLENTLAGHVAAYMGSAGAGEQIITVNVPLDGKVLASTVVRIVNNQARTTGHNPLSAWI